MTGGRFETVAEVCTDERDGIVLPERFLSSFGPWKKLSCRGRPNFFHPFSTDVQKVWKILLVPKIKRLTRLDEENLLSSFPSSHFLYLRIRYRFQ